MALEWMQIDLWFSKKPEIHQVAEETGRDPDFVNVRIQDFWSWASTTTSNGMIKGTPATLARIIGGDVDFWLAVERAGWVVFQSGMIEVPNWEKRFSKAAKARLLDNTARKNRARSGQVSDETRTDAGQKSDRNRTVSGFVPDENRTCSENMQDGNRGKTGPDKIREDKNIREIQLAPSPNSSDSEPVPTPPVSKPTKSKTETKPDPTNVGEVVLTFPVVGESDRPTWDLRQGFVDDFRADFPGVDVLDQFRAALRWIKNNESNRKTARGMRKFLHAWIERSQNRGRASPTVAAGFVAPRETMAERLAKRFAIEGGLQ